MAVRLGVRFEGEGSGTGELSWGQETVWRGIGDRDSAIILAGTDPLPEGTTVADVAGELAYIMSRHQSMRTRFRFTEAGRPYQEVFSSGETFLEIFDVPDGAGPREVAAEVEHTYEYARRDYENEWPIKMAVIRHRGVPVYKVKAMCHLVVDGFGVNAMAADLARRDPVTGEPPGPNTSMQPLEQAQWQASPRGRRQTEGVERHWKRVLETIPPRRFAEPADKRQPRYWQADFASPAASLAIQHIAARNEVDTSPVLLAAFAVGMARVSGTSPAAPRVMVNNRFRPRFAQTVSPLAQTCPCAVDVAGISFDEAVRRAARASVAAYKNAYFDPPRIRRLVDVVSEERGEQVDVGLVYNDRRGDAMRMVPDRVPTADQVLAALPQTVLRWEDPSDDPMDLCHIHVINAPPQVHALVFFDTHYVSPGDVETMLRAVEEVTVAAVKDPGAGTGV